MGEKEDYLLNVLKKNYMYLIWNISENKLKRNIKRVYQIFKIFLRKLGGHLIAKEKLK